ncbi:hypothetical protein GCM10009776_37970 [Microbacterium deminutum]|uniref:Uncharacterized protein n=1 Tax=Microbacterium deminutum TaxID=344164 RepID=A0ABN2RM19_9MICO
MRFDQLIPMRAKHWPYSILAGGWKGRRRFRADYSVHAHGWALRTPAPTETLYLWIAHHDRVAGCDREDRK